MTQSVSLFKQMIVCCLLGFVCSTPVVADIQIDDYTAVTNHRFTIDPDPDPPNFIGAGFDLSGVGQATTGQWGTLISPNVAVTAWHAIPPNLFFYPGNDPGVTPIGRTVIESFRVGDSDIALLKLDSNVPGTFANYSIATTDLTVAMSVPGTVYSAGPYAAGNLEGNDNNAYMFGISQTKPPSPTTWQAVGRNKITGYLENVGGGLGTDVDVLYMAYDSFGGSNYVVNESHFRGGDSGGPLFVNNGGQLTLVGINSALFTVSEMDPTVVGSGSSYLGNHAAAINDYLVANAVPEPSGMACCFAILAVAGLRRVRR